MTNRCPIFSNGKVIGALATFQNVDEVSEAEEKIRRKLYTRGFVANTRFEDMVGESRAFRSVVNMAKGYAKSDATVLISGETGTGKELFAQSIHNEPPQAETVCGDQLRGGAAEHPGERAVRLRGGAFTGAKRGGKRGGVFELAHEGTIFLDEIGEISMDIQLRFCVC